MDRHKLLTLREAAALISEREGREYKPASIRRYINFGLLAGAEKIGRDWFVPREWAESYRPKWKKRKKKNSITPLTYPISMI